MQFCQSRRERQTTFLYESYFPPLMSINPTLSKLLLELADLYELEGVAWKPQSMRRAAQTLEGLVDDVSQLYADGGEDALTDLPAIGKGIAAHIIEYIETEHIAELDELKKKNPGLLELLHIPGLGPKKVKKLYKTLKITNLSKLKKAASSGKIRALPGFAAKSEQEILEGIKLLESNKGRQLLGRILPYAEELLEKLRAQGGVVKAELAGSIRRQEETIGDLDFLVVSKNPEKTIKWFCGQKNVRKVVASGTTKASVVLDIGMNADLRVLPLNQWGSAMQYFTGSKEHNVSIRQLAINKGYKLSEYGLFKKDKCVASKTESSIYKKLGLSYIPPELRQNNGEIDLAKQKKLPKLIDYNNLKGDVHMHTTWSDGSNSTKEMIEECTSLGYQYMGISDHSQSQHIANGLDNKRLLEHVKEIHDLRKKHKIRLLAGSEVDILKSGALDYKDSTLSKLDYVIGSVHMGLKQTKSVATQRICNAMENTHMNILGHATGRLIGARSGYELDWKRVFKTAQDNGVIIEINSQPTRLDISTPIIREAIKQDVKLIINSDAHSTSQLHNIKYGISQARRGHATDDNIINTNPYRTFQKYLSKKA